MTGRYQAGAATAEGAKWLRLAVIGSIMMALGSLLIVWVHADTRADIRAVLTETKGLIRTDGQLQVLNEIMTRGLLLSVGGVGVVVLGVLLAVLGLLLFFASRRSGKKRANEAINAP